MPCSFCSGVGVWYYVDIDRGGQGQGPYFFLSILNGYPFFFFFLLFALPFLQVMITRIPSDLLNHCIDLHGTGIFAYAGQHITVIGLVDTKAGIHGNCIIIYRY